MFVFTTAGSAEFDDWTKCATFRASDRESYDQLGSAVVLSGDIVVADVPNKDAALLAGAVYTVERGVVSVPATNGLGLVCLAASLSIPGMLLLTYRRLRRV